MYIPTSILENGFVLLVKIIFFALCTAAMKNICKCIPRFRFEYVLDFRAFFSSYQRLHRFSDIPTWE